MNIINFLKKIVNPLRKFAGRFVIPPANYDITFHSPISIAAEFVCAECIEGDYLEFGVFKGESFIEAYKRLWHSKRKWAFKEHSGVAYSNNKSRNISNKPVIDRRFIAFDSFEGLPELTDIDLSGEGGRFEKGRYDCTEDNFLKNLANNGVDINEVITVPGYYEDSLTQGLKDKLNIQKSAIVMIDCDLYSSTKSVLEFITNLIGDGTILIFDDWFSYKGSPNHGEQKACNEWLEKNTHIHLIPYVRLGTAQQSFIVNINK